MGGAVAGRWAAWARPQLHRAVAIVDAAPDPVATARLLYRNWFSPVAGEAGPLAERRPLAGLYRSAHAGSGVRVRAEGLNIVGRYDLLGPDGWWRTWGASWTPPRKRRGSVRLMLTPRPERLADLVATVTATLLPTRISWALGCATDPRRVVRYGGAVLDVASVDSLPAGLLDELEPLLRPVTPPLCLPVAAGVGVAEYPDNGMAFGEHRCHLVALALRHPSSGADPLRAIGAVFAAHGIDPGAPHRTRPRGVS
jgi:HopA1 effector protein family